MENHLSELGGYSQMGLRDLSQMEFLEDSDLLAQGFFADRVVDVLQKAGPIDPSDETVLMKVKDFLNTIIEGQKEAKAERLSCTALETMDAYQKAVNVLSQAILKNSEQMTKERFQQLMKEMTSEIQQILDSKIIDSKQKTVALDFFEFLQRQTADQASAYMKERSIQKWPFPATFFRF
jgi:hypothetical protein